jgi:hypothetical protein
VEHRINLRLDRIEEKIMALSPEVQAMKDAVTAALDDLANDVNTLLGRATGLSAEDKEALTAIAAKAQVLLVFLIAPAAATGLNKLPSQGLGNSTIWIVCRA